jgi:hypothetical protein
MPFIRATAKNYFLKKRIDIGLEMGEGKPEDVYIVFKEPTEQDKIDLSEAYSGESAKERLEALYPLFAKLMTEHNFYEDEKTQMQPAAIMDVLKEKSFALEKVITDFTAWIKDPFQKASEQK